MTARAKAAQLYVHCIEALVVRLCVRTMLGVWMVVSYAYTLGGGSVEIYIAWAFGCAREPSCVGQLEMRYSNSRLLCIFAFIMAFRQMAAYEIIYTLRSVECDFVNTPQPYFILYLTQTCNNQILTAKQSCYSDAFEDL